MLYLTSKPQLTDIPGFLNLHRYADGQYRDLAETCQGPNGRPYIDNPDYRRHPDAALVDRPHPTGDHPDTTSDHHDRTADHRDRSEARRRCRHRTTPAGPVDGTCLISAAAEAAAVRRLCGTDEQCRVPPAVTRALLSTRAAMSPLGVRPPPPAHSGYRRLRHRPTPPASAIGSGAGARRPPSALPPATPPRRRPEALSARPV